MISAAVAHDGAALSAGAVVSDRGGTVVGGFRVTVVFGCSVLGVVLGVVVGDVVYSVRYSSLSLDVGVIPAVVVPLRDAVVLSKALGGGSEGASNL